MTPQDRMEALSLAYIQAVAACVGLTWSARSKDYGVDLTLYEVGQQGKQYTETGVRLDVQVKSTATDETEAPEFPVDLPARTYGLLRAQSQVPRILAVLQTPTDPDAWVGHTDTGLTIRRCTYWASLAGRPAVRNRSSVRVSISRQRVFSPAGLRQIIEAVRHGRALT